MQRSHQKFGKSGDGYIFHGLARRRFLQSMAVVGGATLAAPGLVRAAPAPLEGQLVFAGNGGILEQMFHALGNAFEKATGTKVSYVIGTQMGNLAKMQVAKDHPDMDVVFDSDLSHAAAKHTGLLDKLDPAVVINAANVYDSALDSNGVGLACSLCAIGIGYNPQKYQQAGIPAPTSWIDLWDPRLKGRLAISTFDSTWIQNFLVVIARLSGGSEDDIKPGIARIKQLKTNGNLAMTPGSPAELENLVTQGLAWTCVLASIRAYGVQDHGFPFEFIYPKEGAGFYANWMDVVKNAPHPKAAQAFVNFVLSEEGQLIMAANFYGPTNKTIKLPPELAERAPYGAERINSLVKINFDKMNEYLDQWNELWSREIEAK